MKLPEVLAALEAEMPDRAAWRVAILTHKDRLHSNDIVEFPILEVSVDHQDQEINLLTDELSEVGSVDLGWMTLDQLLIALQALREQCSAYSVFSGSAMVSLDDQHEARVDYPLVGVARNSEAQVYGFLQWPPDQWQATA